MAGAKQIGQVASEKGSKILGSLGGTTSTLFFGINAFTTLQDYKQARQEGNGIIGSAASAGSCRGRDAAGSTRPAPAQY